MTGTAQSSRHRRGLRVAGWFFIGIAALLVLVTVLAVLGARETKGSYGLPWAVAVMLAVAAGSALFGRHLHRESTRPPAYHRGARLAVAWACFLISALAGLGTVALVISWVTTGKLSNPVGLVYPASSSVALAQAGRVFLANSRRVPPPEVAVEALPATGKVLYREACSNVNVTLALAAVAVVVFGIWLIAAIPGSGNPGPQGFLVMVPVLPGLWLLFVAASLPYGIVLREDCLQVGVRGVPPAGRMWLRAAVPLDAITWWDVVSRREFKARKAVYRPLPGKPVGAMPGLLVRHLLWVQADPRLVRERFPGYFMQGSYGFTSAEEAGYVQNGLIYIGTRRPKALARALTAALPGKRLLQPAHHAST